MKNALRYIFQKLMGFNNYLYYFSRLSITRVLNGQTEKEFNYFINLLPNKGLILDIGANIGITTIPLAIKKDKAQIFSFEPIPENVRALRRTVKHYKLENVSIFDHALGLEAGSVRMETPIVNKVKMQGLSYIKNSDDPKVPHEVFVEIKQLDKMSEITDFDEITGIKIDVENFEYFVLKGAELLLLRTMPIIYCELWDNERRKLTIDLLCSMGYSVKVYQAGALAPYEHQNTINFFFIPNK